MKFSSFNEWFDELTQDARRRTSRRRKLKRSLGSMRVESLESRQMLSISNPAGSSITPAEGTAFVGTVASFTGTAGNNFTATIEWGDGNTSPGNVGTVSAGSYTVTGTNTYADEGTDTVKVVINDTTDSTTATATGTATVADADALHAGTAVSANATAGITFTGTVATFTNTGYPANPASDFSATINWGDGTTVDTVSGSSISNTSGTLTVTGSHAYMTPGNETATVVISDDAPGTATSNASATFTVAAAPANTLTAVGTVGINATEGTTFSSAALATFTQSNASVPAGSFTATIHWGDGTTGTSGPGSSITVSGSGATLTVSGSHLYADELTGAAVSVVLSQNASTASATASGTATVDEADVLHAGTAVTPTATAGSTFTGTVATFTNSGYPTNPASDFTATINWGDGTTVDTVSGSSITNNGGTLTVTGSHAYAKAGTETATVVLSDDAPGTATASVNTTLTVANHLAPVGTVSISATEGTTFSSTALALFTESDATVPAGDFSATIDWGDGGSLSTVTVSGTGNGTLTVAGSHLYADELAGAPVSVVLNENAPVTGSATATGTANVADADVLHAGAAVTPTATAGSTFTGMVATFTNTGYPTNPASDFTATINWGDGTTVDTVSGSSITNTAGTLTVTGSHLYAKAGTETATVVLSDHAPGTATAAANTTFTVANHLAPVGNVSISATEDTTFSSTALALFTESDATVPAGDFSATIDWGDGGSLSTVTVSGTGNGTLTVAGSHLYADELAGAPVSVVLNENAPVTGSATATGTANVADADVLHAGAAVTPTATAGSTFTGTVATFTNTGYPTNPASDFTATINWGDGTTVDTVSGSSITNTAGTLTVTGSHLYAKAGTETATVVLSDHAPGTATAAVNTTFTVANHLAPVGTVSISATEDTTFSSTALALFTESDATVPAGDFSATIDWGDGGSLSTVTVSGTGNGTLTVAGSHLYADELAGAPVSVVLNENAPVTGSATATGTATVADADVLHAGTAITANATAGITFTGTVATFTNTGYPTNPASDFTATINWGDGTTVDTVSGSSITNTSGTLTVTGSHAYMTPGNETATVVISDDAPGTATAAASATFTVAVAPANTLTAVGTVGINTTEGTTFSSAALATFTQSNASVPAGSFTATIHWGDGTTGTSGPGSSITVSGSGTTLTVSGSHLYADELTGAVSVVLSQNASTASATASGTATVADADVLHAGTAVTPTATAGSTFTGTVATFTNSGYPTNPSSDFTATINWGDGTTVETVSGSSITNTAGTLTVTGSHVYAKSGNETATVVISDNAPGTATAAATTTFTVANGLTPVGTVSISATEGTTFSSTALALFTESDTTIPASDFTATIDWGDGGTHSTVSVSGTGNGTLTVAGSHLYADELAGAPVSIVLSENAPGIGSATATGAANVADADVLHAGTPVSATATAGSTFTGTVATFTNTGYPTNPSSDFTATINWGDGTTLDTVSGSSITNSAGTLTVTGSHVYTKAGTESATIVLSDDAPGTATASASTTFTVANHLAPVGTVSISATEGTTFSSTALALFTESDATVPASDFTATINWGDGSTLSTVTVGGTGNGTLTVAGSHLYADELAGAAVSVVLNENAPITGSATATGTATVADADVLHAGTPITASATAGITFTGTVATFTNTGYPTNPASDFTATINWGDGTTVDTVSGSSITNTGGTLTVTGSHAYTTSGNETATVVISDDAPGTANASATATFTVAVAPANTLTAVGTVGISATEGTTFSGMALATFTQSNASVPAGSFTATIHWGDGTTGTSGPGSSITVSGSGATLTVSGSHLYADELSGAAVTVVLSQNASTASATATGTATVADADVLHAGTPSTTTVTAGSTFSGTVATFTNTGYPNNPGSDFTATINWGDGTSGTGNVTLSASGTLTVTGSHVYATAGTNIATVVLTDKAPGTASATATAAFTVVPVPNSLTPVGTVSINATVGATFSSSTLATFTETNPTVPASSFTATINWGDGSTSGGTVSGAGGTLTVAGSHLYGAALSAAPVSVVLTQNAPGTASATATGTATVTATPVTPSTGYLAGQPGDGTNQTFVHNLYRELLGREPDAAGQASWLSILGTTPASASLRATVANGFLNSPEYRAHFVTTAYETLLGREPDPGGLVYFVGVLDQYQDFMLVIEWISGSNEYFARNGGTNASFITALYRDLLGRAEDPAAVGWVNMLNAGQLPRAQVVRDILFSHEGLEKLFNGNFAFPNGGTPNAPAGSPQKGSYALATLTGNGIGNLYYQGTLNQPAIDNAVNFLYVLGNNQINGNQVNTTQMLVNYLSTPQYFG